MGCVGTLAHGGILFRISNYSCVLWDRQRARKNAESVAALARSLARETQTWMLSQIENLVAIRVHATKFDALDVDLAKHFSV